MWQLSGLLIWFLLVVDSAKSIGSYLQDVELVAQTPRVRSFNTVYYYPSYVKGQDPVEEYNRRRLHVDTARFMEDDGGSSSSLMPPPPEAKKSRPPSQRSKLRKPNRLHAAAGAARAEDHDYNYWKVRQSSGLPRYIKDDVELFEVDEHNRIKSRRKGMKQRRDRDRRTRMIAPERPEAPVTEAPRRYEQSDPQVFAYERPGSAEVSIERANQVQQPLAPWDSKYFQFFELFGDGSYVAGGRRGNDQHYVEQLERASQGAGVFQKKVKWADKNGGFGEHYWDLNHVGQQTDADGHTTDG
ncbi:uncharacterized protein LOC118464511 [Anopheles albimanus]|uniref:Uncharacterized protein n=1 Tax=Anopheles albimanus TaxID=7167 RepID=A0A182F9S5_ANOAL|nr:uncharacterized protein LOC118464511 [Anopheles albimanus]